MQVRMIGPIGRVTSSPNYKWWAYSAIAVGMFLTVMDQSGVNIALPLIADHFHADIPTVQWVTLGYVLGTSAMLMPMGRLSDMLGRKTVYMGGFVAFVTFAIIGGTSESIGMLITAKVLQGIGSAAIQANGMAMVADAFPERERGKALGFYMTIIGTGAISGPIVGGLLVSEFGWRSIFFASAPVGVLAFLAATLVLQNRTAGQTGKRPKRSFDWGGAALSSGALISFLLGMTNAHKLGWDSPPIIGAFALAVVLAAGFIWWEKRVSDPMLDLSFFKSPVFSGGVSARFLQFLGQSSIFFLMPFYLVQGLGFAPSQAALLMIPGPIGMAIMGPLSGRFSDKIGTRWLTVTGMALSVAALLTFSMLHEGSPAIHVMIGMALSGCGNGVFSSPNTSSIMSAQPRERYGIISAFLNLTRTSANVTGVAIATTIVTFTMASSGFEPSLSAVNGEGGEAVRMAFMEGLKRAYLIGAGFATTALVITALKGETRPAPTPESGPRESKSAPA